MVNHMNNSDLVFKLMDVFRRTPMAQEEQLKLSMQLLAWAYLSENQTLSERLRIKNYASSTNEELEDLWGLLDLEVGIRDTLFLGVKPFQHISNREIQDAIHLILNASSAGFIKELDLTDIVCEFRFCGEIAIPPEIADYLVALAELEEKTTIYLPWDGSGQLMGRVAMQSRCVYVETPSTAPYPFIIRLFHDEVDIAITNPIIQPKGIEGGKLRTFGTAISFPPFGIKYDEKDIVNDWFNRFPEKTTNGTILWIRHILAQTKGLAVIAVPNTVLFSAGMEKMLRQDLLSSRKVKAVISLPSKLLYSTGISFSVLILSNEMPCHKVLFIDAATTDFFKKSNKTRDTLSNLDELIAISTGKQSSKYGLQVAVEDILNNDSQLQPSHYVMSEKDNQLNAKFSGMPKRRLDDVVTLVRPMNTLSDSDEEQGIVAYEIGAANMPEYGCINTHGREVTISSDAVKKNQHQFLKSGDIVLIIKGSVGKLGIVGNAPPAGEGGWVAGQSFIVLRLNTSSIDARWLFVFLRSEIGQALISKLVSGATISLLKLNDLPKLEIPVSDREAQQKIIADFDQEVALQSQIDEIHKKQTELAKKYWSLD